MVQPSQDELDNPASNLRTFWIERGWSNGGPTIASFYGSEWMDREPMAEDWIKTPQLAQTLSQWQRDAAKASAQEAIIRHMAAGLEAN